MNNIIHTSLLLCCISTPYLLVTKLGGRHPVTGRKVIEAVGGGSKQKARWIDWLRFELLLKATS